MPCVKMFTMKNKNAIQPAKKWSVMFVIRDCKQIEEFGIGAMAERGIIAREFQNESFILTAPRPSGEHP